jgi:cytochrome c peroxidase
MIGRARVAVTLLAGSLLAMAWQAPMDGAGDDLAPELGERERARIAGHSPLPPPPTDPTNRFADDPAAARFGQRVFFDARFSRNGAIACATCHLPELAFTDGRQLARGLADVNRHAPTLLNVAYQRWFFHDGRADSLWAQAVQPIENPLEMGSNRMRVLRAIAGDELLRAEYTALFGALPELGDEQRFPLDARPVPGDPRHPEGKAWNGMAPADREAVERAFSNVAKAIAAYERRLVGGTSAFDRFAAGLAEGDAEKQAALSPSARRGLQLFMGKAGCRLCHGGPAFSDGEFHDLGVAPLGGGMRTDPGRHAGVESVLRDSFNALSAYSDAREGAPRDKLEFLARGPELWGQFKTPTLRNVARTAPYMHQGQLATLRDVVHFYSTLEGAAPAGHHQELTLQPLGLSAEEQADLVAFLESLTDEPLDPALLAAPRR